MNRLPTRENPITIEKSGRLPETRHVLSKPERLALEMALTTGRPLLVRGEPGIGKSQLARAAAELLGWPFVREVVNARTEATDLLWRFDRVERLAKAQLLLALSQQQEVAGDAKGDAEAGARMLDPHKALEPSQFVTPGPLWRAMSWDSAEKLQKWPHEVPEKWNKEDKGKRSVVLLIDEIDKADSSVPSALLSALAEGTFRTPSGEVGRDNGMPLIIITTNEDRMLPPAFVRRCLVLNLKLHKEEKELVKWLDERGEAHYGGVAQDVRRNAATLVHKHRQQARDAGVCPPGLSEYLDLLKALDEWKGSEKEGQLELLNDLAQFALEKHPTELE